LLVLQTYQCEGIWLCTIMFSNALDGFAGIATTDLLGWQINLRLSSTERTIFHKAYCDHSSLLVTRQFLDSFFGFQARLLSLRFSLNLTMKDGSACPSFMFYLHLFTWETLLLHLSCKSVVGHKKWHKYSEGDHMALLGSSVSNHLWHLCHTYLFLWKPDYKRKRRLKVEIQLHESYFHGWPICT
jgi:hypothetical protein